MRFCALVMLLSLGTFVPRAEAQNLGVIDGQFLLDGPSPKADAPPRVKKGDMAVRNWEVCAKADVPDETLLVDAKSKGIANIVVYLRKAPAGMPAALQAPKVKEIKFDQKACRFEPRILPVQIGQTINCTSQDPVPHNLRTSGFANENVNFVVNQGTPSPVNLLKPDHLPIAVACDFHGWMDAYWIATNHPYVAVTDADGKFSIKDLPVGDHDFTVWHETGFVPVPSGKTLKVSVKAGQQTIPPIKVSASHFVQAIEKRRQK